MKRELSVHLGFCWGGLESVGNMENIRRGILVVAIWACLFYEVDAKDHSGMYV